MKRCLVWLAILFCLCVVVAVPSTARADTGRIVIVDVIDTYPWPPLPPPPPPYYNWQNSQINSGNTNINSPNTNVNSGNTTNNNLLSQNTGTQITINGNSMPTPTQFVAAGKGFNFNEPRQNGVIAWNGKEEILILSTDENSTVAGGGAALSVLPLPGKPVSIMPASTKAFEDAVAMIQRKLSTVAKGQVMLEAKIGTHNIFVWKLDSPDDFAKQVRAYIKEKYAGKADAMVTEDAEKVIKQYFAEGFRYFAFDLSFMTEKPETKVAIAYRFESPYVYYPLVVSRIGGTGTTRVTLAVFTPGLLHNFKGLRHEEVKVFGDKSVEVTAADLEPIDAELAKLMGSSPFVGRIFTITGELNKFDGDLMAW
ncbi:MAG TPA: hypothetical protein VJL29_11825 [Thermoguttaceae bacterium]|nr:hypothetical protein [Thermoguttaceae bacterium]